MTQDEIKEKYPIGSRWVNEKDVVYMVTGYIENAAVLQIFLGNKVCSYVYLHNEFDLKPYTEPKRRTFYLHVSNSADNSYKPVILDHRHPSKELFSTIKKVTLTEGEFDD